MYKVFAKLDLNKCIIDIESSAFYDEKCLLNDGYIQIDEGTDGIIYGHAQPNYLKERYGKSVYDENVLPNFKYDNNNVIELNDEEKHQLFPPVKPEPSEEDKQFADIYLQLAALQATNGTPMIISAISPRYEQIKKYYDLGLYIEEDLNLFVQVGWISEEEKNNIMQRGV